MEETVYQLCLPCERVVSAENAWSKFNLRPPKRIDMGLTPRDAHVFAAEYCSMFEKGWRSRDIAEHWGISLSQLWSRVDRLRLRGYQLPSRKALRERMVNSDGEHVLVPDEKGFSGRPRNEHGGGRWGIKKCTDGPDGKRCELCMQRCRATSRALAAARRKQETDRPS